jgi:pimeloyl-ACP methyl ester carboxylesterase
MATLAFQEYGQGHQPIILLHGFPMNSKVWNSYAPKFSANFKVYTPDLPGFGESPLRKNVFSIQDIGREVLDWLAARNVDKCVLIGHSLGGYVALAMAGQDPKRFAGLGLFHSTALADSDEKKQSRTKVVEFVEKNGAPAFTASFIPPLFADKDDVRVNHIRSISVESSAAAVTGYTLAMRDRPETVAILRQFKKPVLFIAGEKDPGIPVDTIRQQAAVCADPEVHVLAGVAHMGMIEAEPQTVEIIQRFSERAFSGPK